ncbi:MAG: peptidoglycan-binding protein [Desulfamplus sp.]|nr:peptidoglycan-binding protein [Desulfamplus sp.]
MTDWKIGKKSVMNIQKRLIQLGYNPGSVDGKKGRKTIEALKKFQQDNNLSSTGQPDNQTIDTLRKLTQNIGNKMNPNKKAMKTSKPVNSNPVLPAAGKEESHSTSIPLPAADEGASPSTKPVISPSEPTQTSPQTTSPSKQANETPKDPKPIKVRSVMDL